MNDNHFDSLINCPLFKGLSPEELESAFDNLHYQIKTYDKGEMIAQSGEQCEQLILIATGAVKGEMSDFSGKVIKIEDIEAPNTAASAFIFGKENFFPVNIIVTKPQTVIFHIGKKELLKLYQSNERILQNYLNIISNRAQFLASKMRFLTFKNLKAKLAGYLLKRSGNTLKSFELGKTQNELSELFGVARPSLARVFGEFTEEDIISVEKKIITIHNKQKLVSYLKD